MAFIKKTWKNRVSQYPNRRQLTEVSTGIYDVTRAEGTVAQAGDAFDQANMNDLEQRLANAFTDLAIKQVKTGSLTMATTAANQYITQEITFDTPFTSGVVVGFANPRTGDPRAVAAAVNTINQNRIMISLSRLAAGSTYIDWIAFGI